MIYVTGDVHGVFDRLVEIADTTPLRKDDKLIICGDFGFIWEEKGKALQKEEEMLDKIEEFPFEIIWLDGNHENFNKLYTYPEEKQYGNTVHRIRNNVFHLKRGKLYTIENKTFFVFGGAYSYDRMYRRKNISWWQQEIPSGNEMDSSTDTLVDCGFRVDYILTHTAPTEICRRMGFTPDPHDAEFTGYLEWVMHETSFNKWFFGHFHEDKQVTAKMIAVYNKVHKIG